MSARSSSDPAISVVIPAKDESESLPELCQWIRRVMHENGFSYEIIIIDNGSVENETKRLFAELGFASIDLVVLGERLEQFYGRKLPFGPFLAGLRTRGADDLALGELVAFQIELLEWAQRAAGDEKPAVSPARQQLERLADRNR